MATLAGQVLQQGYRVVIASPDKDFKQLISEDVQIVMPLAELDRWSFYTLKHYIAQYDCNPCCDLSLSKYEMHFGIHQFSYCNYYSFTTAGYNLHSTNTHVLIFSPFEFIR